MRASPAFLARLAPEAAPGALNPVAETANAAAGL